MVSTMQFAELQQGNLQIDRLLERDIRQIFENMDLSDLTGTRDTFLAVAPALSTQYGAISASLAADFFEDAVGASPLVSPAAKQAAVQASVRWALGALWANAPTLVQVAAPVAVTVAAPHVINAVTGVMQRHVRQAGRDTIYQSTRDTRGVTYARVPGGGDTCPFCIMTASRGAVYGTARDAGGEGNTYHDNCFCQPIPVRDESDYPEQYDPDSLYDKYLEYRDAGLL